MRVHALANDLETARLAVERGATVVQLLLRGAPTEDVVALGRELQQLAVELVVNDDIEAALELGCGVHLRQSDPCTSFQRSLSRRAKRLHVRA